MLIDSYNLVKSRVQEALRRSGREEDVLILAVSKTRTVEEIRELYDAGVRDFGENYVQELMAKQPLLPSDIRWHMIGHLQRNKVKYIAPFIYMIHSVDTASLADTIEKEAAKCGRVIPVLIEVNVAGEESKYGVSPEEVPALAAQIGRLQHVSMKGLMTSAPLADDPEEVRPVFRKLRQIGVDMNLENVNNVRVDVLSMGMSNDFEVAVEEGAGCVRIGTTIFGPRDYSGR